MPRSVNWRHGVLLAIVMGLFLAVMTRAPIPQPLDYHVFADSRAWFGVPNFLDVISNLPFLIVGVMGVQVALGTPSGPLRRAWLTLFFGVTFVSAGSAYYHWDPANATLVWDRLPMTVGFMGFFTALLAHFVHPRLTSLLLPLVLLGVASVVYWAWTDDLRPYIWVQAVPLLSVPTLLILFPKAGYRSTSLILALAFYLLAKATETLDGRIFDGLGGVVGGHAIKHVLAAVGCYYLVRTLAQWQGVKQPGPSGKA